MSIFKNHKKRHPLSFLFLYPWFSKSLAAAVIEHAQLEIAKHINGNIDSAYWEFGKMLHERKVESGHWDDVVCQLSVDLKERYPKMGLSPRQLWNMKKFYLRYAGHDEKLLRAVALLPWSHNLLIMSKNKNDEATLFYAKKLLLKVGIATYYLTRLS